MRRIPGCERHRDQVPAPGIAQEIAVKALVIAAANRRRHCRKEACKRIGWLECHDLIDIAYAPAPFHRMIGGWGEDALY
jgi:hypothetical protein